MKKKLISAAGVLGSLLTPVVTLAGEPGNLSTLQTYIRAVIIFINQVLVPLIFALAFIVFIWGVFKYFILGGADESKRAEGKGLMMYAIIGFVLMVSLWGLVNFVAENFGFQNQGIKNIPITPLPKRQ